MDKKLFAFFNKDNVAMVITEDGNGVINTEANNKIDAMINLGVYGTNFHDQYNELFPQGWSIEWVDDPENHEGVMQATKINRLKICN